MGVERVTTPQGRRFINHGLIGISDGEFTFPIQRGEELFGLANGLYSCEEKQIRKDLGWVSYWCFER